jgi:hypothetical protein
MFWPPPTQACQSRADTPPTNHSGQAGSQAGHSINSEVDSPPITAQLALRGAKHTCQTMQRRQRSYQRASPTEPQHPREQDPEREDVTQGDIELHARPCSTPPGKSPLQAAGRRSLDTLFFDRVCHYFGRTAAKGATHARQTTRHQTHSPLPGVRGHPLSLPTGSSLEPAATLEQRKNHNPGKRPLKRGQKRLGISSTHRLEANGRERASLVSRQPGSQIPSPHETAMTRGVGGRIEPLSVIVIPKRLFPARPAARPHPFSG